MDRFISHDLVDFSFPFKSDDYVSGHIIEPREKSGSSSLQELFNLLVPSVSFFISFFLANLFYFFSVFAIALAAKKCFILGNRVTVGPKILAKFKAYKFLLISYVLLAFFETQLISNNLSTEKVIVDVSDLMHSEEAIRTTKRKPCFLGSNDSNLLLIWT